MLMRLLIAVTILCFVGPLQCAARTVVSDGHTAAEPAKGIASIEKVSLGNLEQTISIRGQDLSRPILLLLHGGPGFSDWLFFRTYNSELEKDFVVVNWDQRGTGLSYSPAIPAKTMTIPQFVADAHQLVSLLKKRFGKQKIFLLGHSWGSILGATLAHDYPEDFYAYVGVGQIANLMENERISLRYTLAKALDDNNQAAVAELKEIERVYPSKNPDAIKYLQRQREWLLRYGGVFYGDMNYQKLFAGINVEEKRLYDDDLISKGERFSMHNLWGQILDVDLIGTATEFKIPIYFLAGRADYNTPSELSEKYLDKIKAPSKELLWFEKSGHFIPFEEPQKFNDVMRSKVLKENYPDRGGSD